MQITTEKQRMRAYCKFLGTDGDITSRMTHWLLYNMPEPMARSEAIYYAVRKEVEDFLA